MSIIKDNRIVCNITFATRFESFLKNIKVNDPMTEEELEYMRTVAQSLLLHQVRTATDEDELKYLCRCHIK